MPTAHLNKVTAKRATLLYCIYAEIIINLGKVIRDNLVVLIEAKIVGGHIHRCLITALCLKAGVKVDALESKVNLVALIDELAISKFTCWAKGAPIPSSLRFNVNQDSQVSPICKLCLALGKTHLRQTHLR